MNCRFPQNYRLLFSFSSYLDILLIVSKQFFGILDAVCFDEVRMCNKGHIHEYKEDELEKDVIDPETHFKCSLIHRCWIQGKKCF